MVELPQDSIRKKAAHSGDPFKENTYFKNAEPTMRLLWERLVWPTIQDSDFSVVVDLAAGHGRNSALLKDLTPQLYIVDINQECIDACKARFPDATNITYIVNDGATLTDIPTESVTLLYCFDAMVHFESDVVRQYLIEAFRILKPGGRAFLHHSNYTGNPGGDFRVNPHWRNFMSKELMAHYAINAGLSIVSQQVIDWGWQLGPNWTVTGYTDPQLDCVSLLEKPADARYIPPPQPEPPAPFPVSPPQPMPPPAALADEALSPTLRVAKMTYHGLVPLPLRLRLRDIRQNILGGQ
jgi:SAM-dependent methyltransferase